jgi:hypothetical protein
MKVIRFVSEDVVEYPEACPECGCSVFADPPLPDAEQLRFEASAEVGNANGVFDGAYEFGVEGEVVGSADDIGRAVARYLKTLTAADVEAMKYDTQRFFVRLVIEPKGH